MDNSLLAVRDINHKYIVVERINKELDNIHYDGLSPTASQDGSELIAEAEVLLRRGAEVPSEALEIYNKYIGG